MIKQVAIIFLLNYLEQLSHQFSLCNYYVWLNFIASYIYAIKRGVLEILFTKVNNVIFQKSITVKICVLAIMGIDISQLVSHCLCMSISYHDV